MLPAPLLLVSSLLHHTYYPVSIAKSPFTPTSKNIIRYANCYWINNRSAKPIHLEYPNLRKYNQITTNDINLPASKIFDIDGAMVPFERNHTIHNHHVIVKNKYEIIALPLTHNQTRLFIFWKSNDHPLQANDPMGQPDT